MDGLMNRPKTVPRCMQCTNQMPLISDAETVLGLSFKENCSNGDDLTSTNCHLDTQQCLGSPAGADRISWLAHGSFWRSWQDDSLFSAAADGNNAAWRLNVGRQQRIDPREDARKVWNSEFRLRFNVINSTRNMHFCRYLLMTNNKSLIEQPLSSLLNSPGAKIWIQTSSRCWPGPFSGGRIQHF